MAKRKRRRLKVDPTRQAVGPLGGYRYQILHSVYAWVRLAGDEILYLECAEDFDNILDGTVTATQVKDKQNPITLRSQDVIEAISHYWQLRTENPDWRVKFRLLTRSKIGVEQGSPFGIGNPGLKVWSHCSHHDKAKILEISEFLRDERKMSEELEKFLKRAEPKEIYEKLINPITWETSSKSADAVKQSIKDKLVNLAVSLQLLPSDCENAVDRLIDEAWSAASQKEHRELTRADVLRIIEDEATQRVPNQRLRYLEMLEARVQSLDTGAAISLGGIKGFTIRPAASILKTIPRLISDVFPRTDLCQLIQAKLESDGVAAICGGVGKGKTTLAKLTASAVGGRWFMMSCKDIDSTQIGEQLRQIAVEISDHPKQSNIVLEDLDARLHKLKNYQEEIRFLVDELMDRGGRLLITCQHRLPDTFLRDMGVEPPTVALVSNFIISEIEKFAEQLGCPGCVATNCAEWIGMHTNGHPMLVNVLLNRFRATGWRLPDTVDGILNPPKEVGEERRAARHLLEDLPTDHREFLYRLSPVVSFRRNLALGIGEIPKPLRQPGHIFDQLVGPWIDRVDEYYYTVSPLLRNAAQEVWPEGKTKRLHAQIADAILEASNPSMMEAVAAITHSITGRNKRGFISVIHALRFAREEDWKQISQEFSWMIDVKPELPESLFPGDGNVKHLFRSLQHRLAVEVDPESAAKILEMWDKESKLHEANQLYRLMMATQALQYYQVLLPAKQMVGYLKEIINTTNSDEKIREIYEQNYMVQIEEQNFDKAKYFSFLFSLIVARRPITPPFLGELIDALDELPQEIRGQLLADFKSDTIASSLLIDAVWWAQENLERPDWSACHQVFDRVIEKAIAWGYPHLAAASARGKAIIYDEYLDEHDAALRVLNEIRVKVGTLPAIEEERANVLMRQKRYREALSIYTRILSKWNPPCEQLKVGPLIEYRRAAICAAQMDEWDKAATYFEEGGRRTESIEKSERHIGLYADAGFAHFKAGNVLESINLLNLALKEFDRLDQCSENAKYVTLKKCLVGIVKCIAKYRSDEKHSELDQLPAGICSNPEPDEKYSSLVDVPIEYAWYYLAQIEYRHSNATTALIRTLEYLDHEVDPAFWSCLCVLQLQYDLRNKSLDEVPHRIHQLASACNSLRRQYEYGVRSRTSGIDASSIVALGNIASVENIISILAPALFVALRTGVNLPDILNIWHTKSSELPINENLIAALDMIQSLLTGNVNNALTVVRTQNAGAATRFVAALKIVYSGQSNLANLLNAQVFIAVSLIGNVLEDPVLNDVSEILSAQWLQKTRLPATLRAPRITVPQIEKACNSNETGRKKIAAILLAAYEAVSLELHPGTLEKLRSWI